MKMIRVGALFTILFLLVACREPSAEELAAKIAASPEMSSLDQLCMDFPKPHTFREVKKGISGNAEKTIIFYRYADSGPFSSVRGFYRNPLNLGDFQFIGEDYSEPEAFISLIKFRRRDMIVVVEHRPPSSIITIECVRYTYHD